VQLSIRRRLLVDQLEKLQPLLMPMPALALADDLSIVCVIQNPGN
jgi:hypothetical protein